MTNSHPTTIWYQTITNGSKSRPISIETKSSVTVDHLIKAIFRESAGFFPGLAPGHLNLYYADDDCPIDPRRRLDELLASSPPGLGESDPLVVKVGGKEIRHFGSL